MRGLEVGGGPGQRTVSARPGKASGKGKKLSRSKNCFKKQNRRPGLKMQRSLFPPFGKKLRSCFLLWRGTRVPL